MDWCTRCICYLHMDLFHVCQFKCDDKYEWCIVQGQGGGSACVVVCIMNSSLDEAQILISFIIVTRPPPTTTKRCTVSCSAHIRCAIMAQKSQGVESLSTLIRLTSTCVASPFMLAAVIFLPLRWLFLLPTPHPLWVLLLRQRHHCQPHTACWAVSMICCLMVKDKCWMFDHWVGRVVWCYFLHALCWVGCAVTGAFACLDW